MSMYGFDASFYDYGFSDSRSLYYGNFDDDLYFTRRPPPTSETPTPEEERRRHDGTSPLPLGMDWSLPPRIWEGRNTVWPHDSHKRWSYCVTVPSWTIASSTSGSDTVFFKVQVGIQSPAGIIFLELEAAARESCFELNLHDSAANLLPSDQFLSNATSVIGNSSSKTSELENSCSNETSENQNHAESNIERERSSNMQWDLEELTRKCMELELRLTIEQDARANAELIAATTIKQNEMLIKELDDVKEQVKSLGTSHSELKQKLNKSLKDKLQNKDGQSEMLIKEAAEEHLQ